MNDIYLELCEYYDKRSCSNCEYDGVDEYCFDCVSFKYYSPKE